MNKSIESKVIKEMRYENTRLYYENKKLKQENKTYEKLIKGRIQKVLC